MARMNYSGVGPTTISVLFAVTLEWLKLIAFSLAPSTIIVCSSSILPGFERWICVVFRPFRSLRATPDVDQEAESHPVSSVSCLLKTFTRCTPMIKTCTFRERGDCHSSI